MAARVAGLSDSLRPRVVYLYRCKGGGYQVAGRGTLYDADITLAGGRNVAGGLKGFPTVSAEQLLLWAPEVVLVNNFEPGLSPWTVLEDRNLALLPAAREHRVYLFPMGGFRWDAPSQESPLAWQWLFRVFHPEQPSPSMRGAVVEAYGRLYGYRPDPAELDQILRLDLNGPMRHYREHFTRVEPGP